MGMTNLELHIAAGPILGVADKVAGATFVGMTDLELHAASGPGRGVTDLELYVDAGPVLGMADLELCAVAGPDRSGHDGPLLARCFLPRS